jgi:hypothetical protein
VFIPQEKPQVYDGHRGRDQTRLDGDADNPDDDGVVRGISRFCEVVNHGGSDDDIAKGCSSYPYLFKKEKVV